MDFSDGSDSKASAYNVGDPGSIPASGRSPGEGQEDLLEKEMVIHSSIYSERRGGKNTQKNCTKKIFTSQIITMV